MKIRLHIVAEFNVDPEAYEDYPHDVLGTEALNLYEIGLQEYLTMFNEDQITTKLSIVYEATDG